MCRPFSRRALPLAFPTVLASVLVSAPALAAPHMIHAEPMAGEKIRIDGDLREWPAKMTALGETLQSDASGRERGDQWRWIRRGGGVAGQASSSALLVPRTG